MTQTSDANAPRADSAPLSNRLSDEVDPFIGCEPCDVPPPTGLAAAWFWPKPQIGNTHPGACLPMGMVSASAYSGGYPTGYGRWGKCTEGLPPQLFGERLASGFTHFHPSGVGAIRKYYNYVRVTPVTDVDAGLAAIGRGQSPSWRLVDEVASPGTYACSLGESGVRCELTVTPYGAVHRYTFPETTNGGLLIDLSHGGIGIEDARTIPLRAQMTLDNDTTARGDVTLEGLALSIAVSVRGFDHDQQSALWLGTDLLEDQDEVSFDYIRPSTYQPFGVLFAGPTEAGQQIELRLGFSWRTAKRAKRNVPTQGFESLRQKAADTWQESMGKIRIEGGTTAQRRTFATSLYRSLIKPCRADDESPFWPWDGPFFFDLSTMWDMYKTQLPLAMSLFPEFGSALVRSLLDVVEMEGNFPIGYRMARGYDRFAHQASALAHVTIADALHRGIEGIDWERALTMMAKDLSRGSGEAFMAEGMVHPITHTLDLAYACHCTAQVARHVGDEALAVQMDERATWWVNAFHPETRLLRHSTFYEGGRWNYSFRLMHDMSTRIKIAGGESVFTDQLDAFFGVDAPPVEQVGTTPTRAEMEAGHRLHRFEGLNNEPDMEVPYAYAFAGRHDRLCEVVRAGVNQMFGDTPGGMVGNDDSGAMTSWYVWSALGIFPVAGQDRFVVGTPLFPRAEIDLPGGTFTIIADGTGPEFRYVSAATLNGEPLAVPFLSWRQLNGGTLHLTMSDRPGIWTD